MPFPNSELEFHVISVETTHGLHFDVLSKLYMWFRSISFFLQSETNIKTMNGTSLLLSSSG